MRDEVKHIQNHSAAEVTTGCAGPGLFLLFPAALHMLGWAWCCWCLSARRSWPGIPSLIHQPLLRASSFKRHVFCAVSWINLLRNLALADSFCQSGDAQIAVKQRSPTQRDSRERCTSFPSVTFHYLEGCEQPAWPHPRLCTEVGRDRGLSWFAEIRDTCTKEEEKILLWKDTDEK